MFISYTKSFALAALATLSMQAGVAYSSETVNAALKQPITAGAVIKHGFFHHIARKWAKANLPESDLASFLKASEIWETAASAVVEAAWEYVFGDQKAQPAQAAKLVAYGAALHKLVAEAWKALGLHNQFDDATKAKYDKHVKSFVEDMLAKHFVAMVPAAA